MLRAVYYARDGLFPKGIHNGAPPFDDRSHPGTLNRISASNPLIASGVRSFSLTEGGVGGGPSAPHHRPYTSAIPFPSPSPPHFVELIPLRYSRMKGGQEGRKRERGRKGGGKKEGRRRVRESKEGGGGGEEGENKKMGRRRSLEGCRRARGSGGGVEGGRKGLRPQEGG